LVTQEKQQQRQAGEPLLAIDNVARVILLADDDGAEKVASVTLDRDR